MPVTIPLAADGPLLTVVVGSSRSTVMRSPTPGMVSPNRLGGSGDVNGAPRAYLLHPEVCDLSHCRGDEQRVGQRDDGAAGLAHPLG